MPQSRMLQDLAIDAAESTGLLAGYSDRDLSLVRRHGQTKTGRSIRIRPWHLPMDFVQHPCDRIKIQQTSCIQTRRALNWTTHYAGRHTRVLDISRPLPHGRMPVPKLTGKLPSETQAPCRIPYVINWIAYSTSVVNGVVGIEIRCCLLALLTTRGVVNSREKHDIRASSLLATT